VSKLNLTFDTHYDAKNGFPKTPRAEILDWRNFNMNFYSDEADPKEVLETVCDNYESELIDLRPYMWEHPFIAYVHDPLDKCLELFRHHHLRHLPVMNPTDGSIQGIITRKDLFAYMSL